MAVGLNSSAGSAVGAAIGAATGGGSAVGVGSALGAILGGAVGPSYTPGGGGEVRRQLSSTQPPWPSELQETFIKWLSVYDLETYETGNGVWNRASKGSASNWYDAYALALNTKDADGNYLWISGRFTLDGNYKPIPIEQAAQAIGSGSSGAAGGSPGKSLTMSAIKLWWNSRKPWQKWAWRILGLGVVVGVPILIFRKRKIKVRTRTKKVYVKPRNKYTR